MREVSIASTMNETYIVFIAPQCVRYPNLSTNREKQSNPQDRILKMSMIMHLFFCFFQNEHNCELPEVQSVVRDSDDKCIGDFSSVYV